MSLASTAPTPLRHHHPHCHSLGFSPSSEGCLRQNYQSSLDPWAWAGRAKALLLGGPSHCPQLASLAAMKWSTSPKSWVPASGLPLQDEASAHVCGSKGSPLTQWNSSPTLRRPIQGSLLVNLNINSCKSKEKRKHPSQGTVLTTAHDATKLGLEDLVSGCTDQQGDTAWRSEARGQNPLRSPQPPSGAYKGPSSGLCTH